MLQRLAQEVRFIVRMEQRRPKPGEDVDVE